MATFKFCDWTKKKLDPLDPTFMVVVDGQEFEVCEEGMQEIIKQMESDTPFTQPVIAAPSPAAPAPAPAPPPQVVVAPAPAEHTPAPGSMPQPPMAQASEEVPQPEPVEAPSVAGDVPELHIPEDSRRKLPMPSRKQAEKVVAESVKFDAGTLPALGHPKARKRASQKLRELESNVETDFRRRNAGGSQFKVNDNWKDY